MRLFLPFVVVAFAVSGCGGANDVANLITSTPDTAALQIAEANLESASTTVQGYYAQNGSYDGMTITALRQLDPGLDATFSVNANATSYCLQDEVRTSVPS